MLTAQVPAVAAPVPAIAEPTAIEPSTPTVLTTYLPLRPQLPQRFVPNPRGGEQKIQSDSDWDSAPGSDGDTDEYSSTDDLLPNIPHAKGTYKYTYMSLKAKEKAMKKELNVKSLTSSQERRIRHDGLRQAIAHHHHARAVRAARRAAKLAAGAAAAAAKSRKLQAEADATLADVVSLDERAALRAETRETQAATFNVAPAPSGPDNPVDVDLSDDEVKGRNSPPPSSNNEDEEDDEPEGDE
jgi:hypothetical protein